MSVSNTVPRIEIHTSREGEFLRLHTAGIDQAKERDITPHAGTDLDDFDAVRFEVAMDLTYGNIPINTPVFDLR